MSFPYGYHLVDWENNCAMNWTEGCKNKVKHTSNTIMGLRYFCSEKCYAIYVGVPVKEEGYYDVELIE